MIKVTKIAGESFDLETRRETPKALVLSNGVREFALYVDDETARVVLEMMLEQVPTAPKNGNGKSSAPNSKPSALERLQSSVPAIPVEVRAHEETMPPPMATVGEEPMMEDEDDNLGIEPGEEYNDPSTGAESL